MTDPGGHPETYIPDYDLDKARELLLEFQDLKDIEGNILKNNYCREDYNWYPAMVSQLYWQVFFQYVKYKPLVGRYINGEVGFHFLNGGNFNNLINTLMRPALERTFKINLLFSLVAGNNRLLFKRNKAGMLFYRFSSDDFRTREIKKTLDELGTNYIQVLRPTRIKEVLLSILRHEPYYFVGNVPKQNIFNNNYPMENLDSYKKYLFKKAVNLVEWSISGFVSEYKEHCSQFTGKQLKIFYGLDDANGYIFPVLYACQKNGIKTVALQHGTYTRRHAAYVMDGIDPKSYRWFEKLIVWGDYWKEHLLHISKVHEADRIVIGSNKIPRDYNIGSALKSKPKNILIPYEFLTNTQTVGKYVMKFIELGYTVYFRPRTDEALEDQVAAYGLTKECISKLKIAEELDNWLMEDIDIIAGNMTTLIYELMPYNKIVWILETEFKLIEDLVEEGYAHKVRYEDLDHLDEKYFQRTIVDPAYFFSPESLKSTLSSHVLIHANIN